MSASSAMRRRSASIHEESGWHRRRRLRRNPVRGGGRAVAQGSQSTDSMPRRVCIEDGFNSRLDEMQAAVLRVFLRNA